MLKNDKENEVSHQFNYLSGIYERFYKYKTEDKNIIITSLIKELSNLTIENIKESVFNSTYFDYKVLVSLYFNVAYQVVKGLINVNSAYFLAFEEYLNINKQNNEYNLNLTDEYIHEEKHKDNKNIKQLLKLETKEEIMLIRKLEKSNELSNIIKEYRNFVEHVNILMTDDFENLFKYLPNDENELSYFKAYNLILGHTRIDTKIHTDLKALDFQKQVIALNYIFAYNSSRFNRITIEKYFNTRWK